MISESPPDLTEPIPDGGSWRGPIRLIAGVAATLALAVITVMTMRDAGDAGDLGASGVYLRGIFQSVSATGFALVIYVATRADD